MKLVYADPPYLGQCATYDHFHNDDGDMPWDGKCWNDESTHLLLLEWLTECDGWAYSCNPVDLRFATYFGRVAAWCKTFHQIRGIATQHALEAVVFKESRSFSRKPMVRDWLTSSIAMKKGQRGAKPDVFNDWVLDLITYENGDDFTDLFPGSHSMQRAIDRRAAANEIPS